MHSADACGKVRELWLRYHAAGPVAEINHAVALIEKASPYASIAEGDGRAAVVQGERGDNPH